MKTEKLKEATLGNNHIVASRLSVPIEEFPGMCDIWYEIVWFHGYSNKPNVYGITFLKTLDQAAVESEEEALAIFEEFLNEVNLKTA